MKSLGLERTLIDADAYQHSVKRFAEEGIALPTFAQLADTSTIRAAIQAVLSNVDRNAADPSTSGGSTGSIRPKAPARPTGPSTWSCRPS